MHPQPEDERERIHRAVQGDQAALSELYTQHVDAIYKFLFYRVGDQMVAEDLTAEVFADMISAIRRYKERGVPFRAWLFRIARARLADYWRQVKRRERGDEAWKGFVGANQIQTLPEKYFEYESLQQAMIYLTQAELEVVLLRFVGGLDHQEIAKVIRSNANAVKSRMHRALKKLRDVLESRAMAGEGDGET
ncbi:MAG: sigma-70 family RNA polymerase sigma factor [Anaerolineae bacterium]|nr:sigma-70 family RNA polymerase sigma factor [Anaerolineae bacterium]